MTTPFIRRRRRLSSDAETVLTGLPLFAKLDRRRLAEIARQGQLFRFTPGDIVAYEGKPAGAFHVVVTGEAEAWQGTTIERLRRGDFFGELGSVNSARRSATVVATDELVVLRLPSRIFLDLAEHDGHVGFVLLEQLGRRVEQPAA